ncbi:hypothetical protein POPTR_008G040601v4 [Populus trichocarpa]|uniref:Uncharacterized protein n=1 Tax=Populus trichocarpa TaxID=3694 RepID=A0ACC0SJJ4_POPTR|nr:hypothetical protein BDE02_08G035900 [Populus trichocarpa]KAI9389403.1 hypothetical protein POPTR_008G040601v4 [Populus trichocarpa]
MLIILPFLFNLSAALFCPDVCKGAVKRVALDCEILNFVLLGLFLFVAVHLRFIYC